MNEAQKPLEILNDPNDAMESVSTEISETPDLSLTLEAPENVTEKPQEASNLNLDSPAETAAPSSAEPEEDTSTPETAIAALQQELASHRQELAQQAEQLDAFKKRYLSLAAEFDNFRKRNQREREELEQQIKGKTITELLSVVDNFERARTQLKPASEGEMEIHKSYQSVYKSFVDGLKRLGVAPMRPEGQPFDPNYHEAMLQEQTDEYPEGTVIEELIRGYQLGEMVLRHAMVKVAALKESVIPSGGETTDLSESTDADSPT